MSAGELPEIRGVTGLPEYQTKVTRESFWAAKRLLEGRIDFEVVGAGEASLQRCCSASATDKQEFLP